MQNIYETTGFAGYLQKVLGIFADKQQYNALTCGQGTNIIIAGPGSGKSTVILGRLLYMQQVLNIDMSRVAVLVFNREARDELRRRMSNICRTAGGHVGLPHITTIHSLSYRIVNKVSGLSGQRINITRLSDTEEKMMLGAAYQKLCGRRLTGDELTSIRQDLSEYINRMWWDDPQNRFIFEKKYKGFDIFYQYLSNESRRQRTYSFDNIQAEALRILRGNAIGITHVLLDEAQDVTALQFELVRTLAGQGSGDLFIVGDDDQCIYSFRFAESKYIIEPQKYFSEYMRYEIGTNYRSVKGIVESADKFISQNKNRAAKKLTAFKKENLLPEIKRVARTTDQNRLIADIFKEQKADETMGIIYRNNNSAIQPAQFLIEKGVPIKHIGASPEFFKNKYVLRMLAEIKKQTDICGMEYREKHGKRPYPNMLMRYIDRSRNIFSELTQEASMHGCTTESFGAEREILYWIAENSKNTEEFLNKIKYLKDVFGGTMPISQQYKNEDNKSPLTLVSAHSSKGLEFDCVIIIDANKGIFPTASQEKTLDKAEFIENERRLFYVAMTRAKKRLIIVSPQKRAGKPAEESEFVTELRQLMTYKNEAAGLL